MVRRIVTLLVVGFLASTPCAPQDLATEKHCIPAGQRILTPAGWVPVNRLAPGATVLTPYGPRAIAVITQVVAPKPVIRIVTEGKTVKLTEDHLVLTVQSENNGLRTAWRQAGVLRPNDMIVTYDGVTPLLDVDVTIRDLPGRVGHIVRRVLTPNRREAVAVILPHGCTVERIKRIEKLPVEVSYALQVRGVQTFFVEGVLVHD